MKRIITLFIVVLTWTTVNAQITLENTYNYGSLASNTLYRLDLLEVSPTHYVYSEWRRDITQLVLYNLNHSVFKTISVPTQPDPAFTLYYITETLFDTDSTNVEYLILGTDSVSNARYFTVYNENGTVLFHRDSAYIATWYGGNINWIREPIVTTGQGTKMIVELENETTQIYSLP